MLRDGQVRRRQFAERAQSSGHRLQELIWSAYSTTSKYLTIGSDIAAALETSAWMNSCESQADRFEPSNKLANHHR